MPELQQLLYSIGTSVYQAGDGKTPSDGATPGGDTGSSQSSGGSSGGGDDVIDAEFSETN